MSFCIFQFPMQILTPLFPPFLQQKPRVCSKFYYYTFFFFFFFGNSLQLWNFLFSLSPNCAEHPFPSNEGNLKLACSAILTSPSLPPFESTPLLHSYPTFFRLKITAGQIVFTFLFFSLLQKGCISRPDPGFRLGSFLAFITFFLINQKNCFIIFQVILKK